MALGRPQPPARRIERHNLPLDAPPPRSDPRVREALDFIAAHLDEPVTLARLARHVGVSASHLIRLFERDIGTPPHEAMRAMRLARAAELLSGSALAVKEIGAEVGYRDPSDFTKDFARQYNLPPMRYRLAQSGMIRSTNKMISFTNKKVLKP